MRALTTLASTSAMFLIIASTAMGQTVQTPNGQAMAAVDLCAAWMAGESEASMTERATQAGFQPGSDQWFWSAQGDPASPHDRVSLVMDSTRGCYVEVQPGSVAREDVAEALIAWSTADGRAYVREPADPTQAGARVILLRTPETDIVGMVYPEGGETYGHAVAIDFWQGRGATTR